MDLNVDRYSVFSRGRNFDILVFPKYENAWAFYERYDDQYEIDGDKGFFKLMLFALVALADDPTKIIYLPIRHLGETMYGAEETYDAVLVRPELQFPRSDWRSIRRRLDRNHFRGVHTIEYVPERVEAVWEKYWKNHPWHFSKEGSIYNRVYTKNITEDLYASTVFLVLPKNVCGIYHHLIAESLDDPYDCYPEGNYVGIGYIMPPEATERLRGYAK